MANILANFPELPLERRARFVSQYQLPEYDADILTAERSLSDYFEAAVKSYGGDAKRVSNWLMNDVLRMINERGLSAAELKLTPAYLAEIIKLVDANTINTSTGKALLEKVEKGGKAPGEIVATEGLAQVSDLSAIQSVCQQVLDENPDQAAAYRAGKVSLIGWFTGQVMKKSQGKADPKLVKETLEKLLQ